MNAGTSDIDIEIKYDLVILLGLCLAFISLVYIFPLPRVRVAFGLLYALVFPGYAFVAALFPERNVPRGIVRFALSFGLSFVIVPLTGLLLNYTPWGVTLETSLALITVLVVACSGVAYFRRGQLPVEHRFVISLHFDVSRWQGMEPAERWLSVLLALSVLAVIGALAYGVFSPKTGERYTEFYILGPEGTATGYPTAIAPGEPVNLIIGVANREHGDMLYRIERVGPSGTDQVATIQLADGQTWERSYSFTLTQLGEGQEVEFALYRGDEQDPYRSLHLWLKVREE